MRKESRKTPALAGTSRASSKKLYYSDLVDEAKRIGAERNAASVEDTVDAVLCEKGFSEECRAYFRENASRLHRYYLWCVAAYACAPEGKRPTEEELRRFASRRFEMSAPLQLTRESAEMRKAVAAVIRPFFRDFPLRPSVLWTLEMFSR